MSRLDFHREFFSYLHRNPRRNTIPLESRKVFRTASTARGAWMIERQQVFSDSIRVKLDGKAVQRRYLRDSDLIVVTPTEPLSNGVHSIETSLVNYYGNHNLPATRWFKVAPPAETLHLITWAKAIPPDGESYVWVLPLPHTTVMTSQLRTTSQFMLTQR